VNGEGKGPEGKFGSGDFQETQTFFVQLLMHRLSKN